MKEKVEHIIQETLSLFSKLGKSIIPLEIVIKELGNDYKLTEIEEAIIQALDTFQIDKVLDYASAEWSLYDGYPIWHLLRLTSEDADKLRNLKKVDLALLGILKNQNGPERLGELKSEDAQNLLREQGFTEKETEFLWVKDLVDHYYEFEDGKSIEWCRLIPEYEKTEEYKKEQERIDEEFARKEEFRMYIADVHDLADEILKTVRESPEGISKKDIIKQLFMSAPDYLKEAFEIATEDNEILPIALENGDEGYKINPEFYLEES